MRASRLGQRFAVWVIGVSSALTLALTGFQFAYDYRRELSDCSEQLGRIGTMSAESLAESLWQVDQPQIKLQLAGIMRLPNLSFAAVRDQDGKTIASLGERPRGSSQSQKIFLKYLRAGHAEAVGELEVVASNAPMLWHLCQRLIVALASNAVKTFLVAFFILFLAHVLIIRRIGALSVAVEAFGDYVDEVQDLTSRLSLRDPVSPLAPKGDEIAALYDSVRAMCEKRTAVETALREAELAGRADKLRAEAASAAKTAFLANVSHELRTPLTAILGFTELATELSEEAREAGLQFYLPRIGKAAQHLLILVNDLLLVSSAEIGGIKLRRERTDLVELCRHTCDMHQIEAAKLGIKIEFASPKELWAYIDPDRVHQIVSNLLNNAIKFSPGGGTVLTQISSPDPSHVQLMVRDHGIGIAPEHRSMIFGAFGRVDTSHHTSYQGTGLGLAIVQHLVALHGGRVWLESEVGVGSSFFCSLPLG